MDKVILRKATEADCEFAYEARKAAFQEYAEQVWGWDEELERKRHPSRFASQAFRVICAPEGDVGILATKCDSGDLTVKQLFILPEHQGKGIGSACMEQVIKEAKAKRQTVNLQVLRINDRAIAFYYRMGFRNTDQTDTHVLMFRPPE